MSNFTGVSLWYLAALCEVRVDKVISLLKIASRGKNEISKVSYSTKVHELTFNATTSGKHDAR